MKINMMNINNFIRDNYNTVILSNCCRTRYQTVLNITVPYFFWKTTKRLNNFK